MHVAMVLKPNIDESLIAVTSWDYQKCRRVKWISRFDPSNISLWAKSLSPTWFEELLLLIFHQDRGAMALYGKPGPWRVKSPDVPN